MNRIDFIKTRATNIANLTDINAHGEAHVEFADTLVWVARMYEKNYLSMAKRSRHAMNFVKERTDIARELEGHVSDFWAIERHKMYKLAERILTTEEYEILHGGL